jgi:phospholipid transport system substrate-binding protein
VRRIAVVLAVLSAVVPVASAGALVDLLKSRQARVDALFKASPGELSAADKGKLEEALTGAVDFAEMARAALGTAWAERTAAEQKEFAQAFEALLRASLLRKTGIYRASSVTYDAEKVMGDMGSVKTTVRLKDATTEVGYELRRRGPAWRIADYSVDGVSTVRNYRSQFSKILAKNGFPALIARVRKRTAEIQAEK